MTICAAAIGPDGVWIGADGRTQVNGVVNAQRCRKWTLSPSGEWAISHAGAMSFIGMTASIVAGDDFVWPADHGDAGAIAVATALRLGLQRLSRDGHGINARTDADSTVADWHYSPLLASPTGVWRCDSCLWAISPAIEDAFHAAGSGEDFALGAMSVLRRAGCSSAQRLVREAVGVASRLSATCGGEQWIHRMAVGSPS